MVQLENIEPGPDTFRILLTTDNHVGYMENDPIRGDDSWQTFNEILKIAQDEDVDMVVQGGDLFHVNTPTKKSYYHVMRILRQYCWNGKPIEYKLLSDPGNAITTRHFDYPAEYDTNINVGMPVYAISGNHDDATGDAMLSPLDLLGVSGLINHFGKALNNESIKIYPLLFNKGRTNLALYGLPSIREERLMKTMANGDLEFMEPDSDEMFEWFNLMCIHQNHVRRPGVKVIEETSLPSFLDFVLWGHEHDCITSANENDITGTHILQAGSSIATSLSVGETGAKNVFVLSVKGKDFSLKPIQLKTVRPFVMKEISLKDSKISASSSNKDEVLNFLMLQVNLMIDSANESWKKSNKTLFDEGLFNESDVPLPLIRLKVDYSGGYEVENPRFFSNRFVGKVANVNDVVIYHKRDRRAQLLKIRTEGNNQSDDDKDEQLYIETDDQKNKSNTIIEIVKGELHDEDLIMIDRNKFAETLNNYLTSESKEVMPLFIKEEESEYVALMSQMTIGNGENEELNDELISQKGVNIKSKFKELIKEVKSQIQKEDTQINTQINREKQKAPIPFRKPQKLKKSEEIVINSESEAEEEVETKSGQIYTEKNDPVPSSDDLINDIVILEKPPKQKKSLNSIFSKRK